jgi:choline-sulfatase
MLSRRRFIQAAAVGAGAVVAPGLLRAARAAGRTSRDKPLDRTRDRPNILFIMTDQQHAGMMSCTGNAHLKTPALDALAASGIRFERAYATNPVCVPSRFSLQTGRMPSAVGMRQNESRIKVPREMIDSSLGLLLRRAGYETAYGGKVHVPGNLAAAMRKEGYRFLEVDSRQKLADACAKFLGERHDRPFFLFASFINPHDICYMAINAHRRSLGQEPVANRDSKVCQSLLDRARSSDDLGAFIRDHCPPLPGNFQVPPEEPECITTQYLKARSFRKFARDRWSREDWRLHRWAYCRLTERVDRQIGQVLGALREPGLADRTLVVFTSDHGDLDAAHRLEHKSILYEEAARVPLVMSWPGVIPRGKVDDAHLASNGLDLLPTLCDWAGAAAPKGLTGLSLRPLAEGRPAERWRDHLVVESQNGRMVRTERLKYCVYDSGRGRETLVDLRGDPGEMKNLAALGDYRVELNRHRRLLAEWTHRHKDAIARPYLIAPEGEAACLDLRGRAAL